MIVVGIDPGATVGVAALDAITGVCLYAAEVADAELGKLPAIASGICEGHLVHALVAEQWVNYGRPAGEGSRLAIGQGYWLAREKRAHLMTRPEVIRQLGMIGSVGKSAVWGEVVRQLGSDKQGKLCPRRKNKSHGIAGFIADTDGWTRCPVCSDTGWQRAPGPLAHVKGHARDALALALAWSLREGLAVL